jgi:hypothetical protein
LEDSKAKEIDAYTKRVASINAATLRRLGDHKDPKPLDLAELFEDTANRYMDLSEEIRQTVISAVADS